MFRIGLFFVLLVVSIAAVAQQTIPSKIPFRLRDNVINVQAVIDGKNVSAVLDSGTGGVVVSKSLAGKLGLHLTRSSFQAMGAGKGNQSLFPIKLRTLQFGPLDWHNVTGYAINLHSISTSSGFQVDALLGYPIFRNHAIRINYPKRYVKIYLEGDSPGCGNPIPIEIVHNVPVVVAKIKVRPHSKVKTVHLVVDLGSRHYNYLGDKFLRTEPGKSLFANGHEQVVGDGTGGHAKGVVARFAELDVGTQHFHDVTFALTKQVKAFNLKKVEGSLGVPLWRGGVITFDYPDKQLCIRTPHK